MDFSLIGHKIREVRTHLGLSQKEVCEGICSQAQISKIEKGEVYPSAPTLYQITKRLGLDLNYFFESGLSQRQDYAEEVKKQLAAARRNKNYEDVKEIVKSEMNNPIFTSSKENQQLLLWNKGVYEYSLDRNPELALETLQKALSLSHSNDNVWTEDELAIIMSIGVIYMDEKCIPEAIETFKRAKRYMNNRLNLKDWTLIPRLHFNLSKALTKAELYEKSIACCEEAIEWLIKRDYMYLLGELSYNMGYNYELMKLFEKAIYYYERSLFIFEVQKYLHHIDYIKNRIDALKEN
ncbi:transcriptional regulator with XRE-family HTH domain [Peribacillus deserti]|uniref:Transcriptional regulator with XRE-family HTH domain n=1 Tax=Peribacillus deserti TaxID=673318 RepID=A0ABS2QC30_9BACI|nr:helix-turn-helix domain-containing protein [Peribacillus deserti]MBM7690726.1 transcriptional regulator with XRE-family HTH domain [Peribacillus deserti]